MGQMVPIARAAEELGVSRDTLDRLARAGQLRKFRRPGDRRVFVDIEEARKALGWRQVNPDA